MFEFHKSYRIDGQSVISGPHRALCVRLPPRRGEVRATRRRGMAGDVFGITYEESG
jgi:hypothetical protein